LAGLLQGLSEVLNMGETTGWFFCEGFEDNIFNL